MRIVRLKRLASWLLGRPLAATVVFLALLAVVIVLVRATHVDQSQTHPAVGNRMPGAVVAESAASPTREARSPLRMTTTSATS